MIKIRSGSPVCCAGVATPQGPAARGLFICAINFGILHQYFEIVFKKIKAQPLPPEGSVWASALRWCFGDASSPFYAAISIVLSALAAPASLRSVDGAVWAGSQQREAKRLNLPYRFRKTLSIRV